MNYMNIASRKKLSFSKSALKRLDLMYDVASPYSWFCFEVLHRYKKFWKIDLNLQPVLLGGIFKDSKNVSPLMTSAAKAIHMSDDIKRCATYFDVPIKPMQDRDFTSDEALKSVAEACRMSEDETNKVLEKINSTEIKMQLRKNTEDAVECGVFGVPTIIVKENEEKNIFFGSDRFPILAQEINEEWRGPCPDKSSKL